MTFPVVLVRNLLRLIDILPGFYVVGAISILATRRAQRLGDLAAGTMVVVDAPLDRPQPLVLGEGMAMEGARRGIDVAGVSPEEYGLVRSFLLRRHALEPTARARLAADLAGRLRGRVGDLGANDHPETFLEVLAATYRERWGGGP